MTTYEYKYDEYLTTPENARATLDKYGVAIIPAVLSQDQISAMNDGIWTVLEKLTAKFDVPIDRSKPETYSSFYKLEPNHSMLIQYFGVGHSQYIWNIRQNPNVARVFAELWSCSPTDLHTSFDAVSFAIPPEIMNSTRKGYHHRDWMHCDQSFRRTDLECYQAWVTGFDVVDGDATLAILEKSHLLHKEFADAVLKTPPSSDWHKLKEDQEAWYKEKGCSRVSIKCRAGDMVIWDSRTIHCGQGPVKKRASKNYRHVVYVAMTPKKMTSGRVLKNRISAFEKRRMTTHMPYKCKLFGLKPHTYGKPLPDIQSLDETNEPLALTDLGRSLVGY
jgi:hypothetical protein